MNKEYEWYLKHDLSEFTGKWIAIYDSKVIESDEDIINLNQKLQKKNLLHAFITKVSNNFRVLWFDYDMLTFKFKKIVLEDGSFSYRPIIPVKFVNDANFINAFVLVDTGADVTVLPWGYAKILDLKLGKETKLFGFKEECKAYQSKVKIVIGSGRLTQNHIIPVLILSEHDSKESNDEVVLGLRGFFDVFDIRFKLATNRIDLKVVDNLRRVVYYR